MTSRSPAQILRLLRELQRDFNTAIIFVSSALGVVNEIADSVLVLASGRVVEQQPVRSLISSPQHKYTRQLIQDVPRIWGEAGASSAISLEPSASRETVLSVQDVTKAYEVRDRNRLFGHRLVQAVRGVTFDAYKGENLGIVGEFGMWKVDPLPPAKSS